MLRLKEENTDLDGAGKREETGDSQPWWKPCPFYPSSMILGPGAAPAQHTPDLA